MKTSRFRMLSFVFFFGWFNFHACHPQDPPNREWPFARPRITPSSAAPRRTGIIPNTLAGAGKLYSKLKISLMNEFELVRRGDRCYDENEHEKAIDFYTRAINKNSRNAKYYEYRAMCFWSTNELDKAISDIKAAIRIDGHNIQLWALLIRFLFLARRTKEVEKEIQVLETLELVELGQHLYGVEKFEEAITCYSEAIRRNSSESSYFRFQGECYAKMKKWDEAILMLEAAVDMDTQNNDNRIALSEAFYECKKYEEAIAVILPADDQTLTTMGHKFLNIRRYEEAKCCYTAAVEKNTQNALAYEKRAQCNWKLHHLEEAISDFEQTLIIRPAPGNRDVWIDLIVLLVEAEKYEKAKTTIINFYSCGFVLVPGQEETRKIQEAVWKIVDVERALQSDSR